jgi:hypothetical protein
MYKAVKANREYPVDEKDVARYRELGYRIIEVDADGKIRKPKASKPAAGNKSAAGNPVDNKA